MAVYGDGAQGHLVMNGVSADQKAAKKAAGSSFSGDLAVPNEAAQAALICHLHGDLAVVVGGVLVNMRGANLCRYDVNYYISLGSLQWLIL